MVGVSLYRGRRGGAQGDYLAAQVDSPSLPSAARPALMVTFDYGLARPLRCAVAESENWASRPALNHDLSCRTHQPERAPVQPPIHPEDAEVFKEACEPQARRRTLGGSLQLLPRPFCAPHDTRNGRGADR